MKPIPDIVYEAARKIKFAAIELEERNLGADAFSAVYEKRLRKALAVHNLSDDIVELAVAAALGAALCTTGLIGLSEGVVAKGKANDESWRDCFAPEPILPSIESLKSKS